MDIGPQNMAKRKLRASSACQDLLKGLEELWKALGMLSGSSLKSLPGDSWAILAPARALLELQETCRSYPKPSLGLPEALPSHQTAIASQQSQACSDQSAMF